MKSVTDSDLLKSLVQTAFDVMKASPRASIQRRVLRALLVHSILHTSIPKELTTLCNHTRIDSGTAYTQAKTDYKTMIQGKNVTETEYIRKCIDNNLVSDAVKFILYKANIATVSWGNIDVVLSENETVVLPKITRRASAKILWDQYLEYSLKSGDQYIKRSTFYEILRIITRSDQKLLSSVDYVQSLLVNDSLENLQQMIDDIIDDQEEKNALSDDLSSLGIFL